MGAISRATDTPVLDFWWCLSWVSKSGWIPCLHALSPACNGFLRFTSGATPADLLAASMAASRIRYMQVAEVGCRDSIGRPTQGTTGYDWKGKLLQQITYYLTHSLHLTSLIEIDTTFFTINTINNHTTKYFPLLLHNYSSNRFTEFLRK